MREAALVYQIIRTSTFRNGLIAPIRGSAPFAMRPDIVQT